MTGKTKRKFVVVNADDFGFSRGITEGILRAWRDGIVTSTTIAANMPAAAEAVDRLVEAPGLGVGVHLNVCQGPPLSEEGLALADGDGVMRSKATGLVLTCLRRPCLFAAVEAECDAQIRWVLDRGVRPTHLDSHRHVHGLPPIFLRVLRLARRYDIPFVRWHREVLPGDGWPAVEAKQRRVRLLTNLFGAVNGLLAPSAGHARETWGVGHTGQIDVAWLVRAARAVRPGVTEIMTHPGIADDLDAAQTRLRASRLVELEALCDPAARDAFVRNHVKLAHYGQLRDYRS